MAYDKATDRRIQRMAVQKVAIEAMSPFPVTSKGEPSAAAEKWKEVFIGLCDFLWEDVEAAGKLLAVSDEPATVTPSGNEAEPVLTLDQAIRLTEQVQKVSEGNDVLKNAIKLQFVKFGVKPGPLQECICQLTKPQADELVELITKES